MENNASSGHHAVTPGSTVIDAAGQQAQVLACDQSDDSLDMILQREPGKTLRLPADMLVAREDGNYLLPMTFAAIEEAAPGYGERYVIPVIQEELQVGKRVVDTGRGIRVRQRIVERTEVVDEPLYEDVLELTHVPIGRIVEPGAVPVSRQDGETLIVPVLEEVLVVEKQMRLKEELHITRHKREVRMPQTVVLQSQQVSIEQFDENREKGGTTA